MTTTRTCGALLLAAAGLAVLTGCGTSSAPPSETAASSPGASPDGGASPEPDGDGATSPPDDAFADAFAERERFFADQQQRPGVDELVPRTEAQRALVDAQQAWVEGNGGTWDAQSERITLALALDACETSILNQHRVSAETFRVHVATSSLFMSLLESLPEEQRAEGEANVASIMVFGTDYLCPDDAPQWQAAFDEVYPDRG
ncbi:hypothetical protein [Microbacterium sp. No. 7]|uniref:hypothetical protein n=1 Tax=Microbacterium sp. No. 7 TaxID=1714373 RepID=UPI0006D106A9|nr:hypothetical protein [Microbacterium sp. No. 7]ALJ20357.1 hypothetical protein AOA12_10710 [Microbacterium sp. No. 7]